MARTVAVFRHYPSEGPGYLTDFLDRHAYPWQLIELDRGEPVPPTPLSFECHVEMTEAYVERWGRDGAREIAASSSPWVQPASQIMAAASAEIKSLHLVADQLYQAWCRELRF